jgi:hypothetical protein
MAIAGNHYLLLFGILWYHGNGALDMQQKGKRTRPVNRHTSNTNADSTSYPVWEWLLKQRQS